MRQEIAVLRARLKAHHHITLAELSGYFGDANKAPARRTWADWLGDDPDDPVVRQITLDAITEILKSRGDGLQMDLEDYTSADQPQRHPAEYPSISLRKEG